MHDTPAHMTEKLCEMMQSKTPQDRLEMTWSMYRTSKNLMISYIKKKNPNITNTELKQEIFLRFYKNDFNEEQIKKILAHLESRC